MDITRNCGITARINSTTHTAVMKYISVLMFCLVAGLSLSECLACPQGWVRSGADSCYQFNEDRKSWIDARTACLVQWGDLAIVSTLAEAANLRSIRKSIGWTTGNQNNYYWVGAYGSLDSGFFWLNNAPFNTSLWYDGEPYYIKPRPTYCIDMCSARQKMKFFFYFCSGTLGYICEKSL